MSEYSGEEDALYSEILGWMRRQLATWLEDHLDECGCPNFTGLAEAWADEANVVELTEMHPVWDAACVAFEPYLEELNAL